MRAKSDSIQIVSGHSHGTSAFFDDIVFPSGDTTGSLDNITLQTLNEIIALYTTSYNLMHSNNPWSTATQAATTEWYKSLVAIHPSLPSFKSFKFFSMDPNEAMTRQAMDAFNNHLVHVWEKMQDNYQ